METSLGGRSLSGHSGNLVAEVFTVGTAQKRRGGGGSHSSESIRTRPPGDPSLIRSNPVLSHAVSRSTVGKEFAAAKCNAVEPVSSPAASVGERGRHIVSSTAQTSGSDPITRVSELRRGPNPLRPVGACLKRVPLAEFLKLSADEYGDRRPVQEVHDEPVRREAAQARVDQGVPSARVADGGRDPQGSRILLQ